MPETGLPLRATACLMLALIQLGFPSLALACGNLIRFQAADEPLCAELDVRRLGEDRFKRYFRFRLADLEELVTLLQLPLTVESHRHKADRLTAMCMLLFRFSQCQTWRAQSDFFGRSARACAGIVSATMKLLLLRWSWLLRFPDHLRKNPARFQQCVCKLPARVW